MRDGRREAHNDQAGRVVHVDQLALCDVELLERVRVLGVFDPANQLCSARDTRSAGRAICALAHAGSATRTEDLERVDRITSLRVALGRVLLCGAPFVALRMQLRRRV